MCAVAIAPLSPRWAGNPAQAAAQTLFLYHQLLKQIGLEPNGDRLQSGAYNLLATRDWLMLVSRAAEEYQGVSINALGFAGSLFVKDRAQLEQLRAIGPMAVLRAVAA